MTRGDLLALADRKMNIKQINARIVKLAPNVTLYRGDGYYYYIYDDRAGGYDSLSIMVPYLNMQTPDRWIMEAVEFSEKVAKETLEREGLSA